MTTRSRITCSCALTLVALAGCAENCSTEWETKSPSPNGKLTARVHEDACDGYGSSLSDYQLTRVDVIGRLGRVTTVVSTVNQGGLRPKVVWLSNDALRVVVSNYTLFDQLLTTGGGVYVSILFDPPDPGERARWLNWQAQYAAFRAASQRHSLLMLFGSENAGPEPVEPAPFKPSGQILK